MHCYSLGYGCRDDVEVDLHETLEEPPRWFLQIEIGQFGFNCDVTSPAIVHEWAQYFADTFRTGRFLDTRLECGAYRHMEPKQIELGRIGDVAVVMRKCGIYDDRYFVHVELAGGRVEYIPTLPQVEALIDAVGQVVAALADRELG